VPFFSINLVAAFCRGCVPPLLFAVFTWLGYLNSTMNPVIYRWRLTSPFVSYITAHRSQRDKLDGSGWFLAERLHIRMPSVL